MSKNFITLADAKALTKRYRDNLASIATREYANSLKNSETFDAAAVRAILDQPGCVEFRTYYGMKEDLSICSIFIGVDASGNDIINSTKGGEDVIVEWGITCPPICNDNLL
jgi:hypothetical protein